MKQFAYIFKHPQPVSEIPSYPLKVLEIPNNALKNCTQLGVCKMRSEKRLNAINRYLHEPKLPMTTFFVHLGKSIGCYLRFLPSEVRTICSPGNVYA